MRSALYVGHVLHARIEPVEHRFRYPAFVFALDVDELDTLDDELHLFGHNRRGLFSLHEADYLGVGDDGVRAKLRRRLRAADADIALDRVQLVTTPRVAGHTFNPVSFYYCHDAGGELSGIVAEVNNTFGEAHIYPLPAAEATHRGEGGCRFVTRKRFHVSPFHDMEGDYEFDFAPLGERLDVRIDIRRPGGKAFVSRLYGERRALENTALYRLALTYPFTAALTLPRILWQAFKLHYRKGLPVYRKPEPSSPLTFPATRAPYISELSAPIGSGPRRGAEIRGNHGSD
jgi:cyclopropane-fatty-acyl-phospholipid synthase